MNRGRAVIAALFAAILFGAATPFAKHLLGELPSTLLAGLLYLGSGCGLLVIRLIRDRGWQAIHLSLSEYRWLGGAILFGGMIAPVLLMVGLTHITASAASLLLNLEAVFTALIAWWIFKENAGSRLVLGMFTIVSGGIVLSWPTSNTHGDLIGALYVATACGCWAIDNNFTRKVSKKDAVFLAGCKGLIAGIVNTTIAFILCAQLPNLAIVGEAMTIGLFGYGLSLVLFVVALRGVGAARTGAYFSIAPFVGALLASTMFGETMSLAAWAAGALMATGIAVLLTEGHAHQHRHSAMMHEHLHMHDEHHQHTHEFKWDGKEPHTHPHHHEPMFHSHPHLPDIHHRHEH